MNPQISAAFSIAQKQLQKAALKQFRKTPIGKFQRIVKQSQSSGKKYEKSANKLAQVLGSAGKPFKDRPLSQSEAVKFARGDFSKWLEKQAMNALIRNLGPFGKILADLAKENGERTKSIQDELDAAENVLKAFGYVVQKPLEAKRIAAPGEAPPRAKIAVPSKVRPRVVEPEERQPQKPVMIRTPNSSNVWAYGYDERDETMYVQFQSPALNRAAIKGTPLATFPGSGLKKSQRPHGKLGSTVIGKVNKPGPMYAYYNVPKSVFNKFLRTSSAGGAVWDNLRVRGSAYGHQYSYGLVHGVATQGVDYVPRRASEFGLLQRRMTTPEGRELISLLPSERGKWGTDDRGRAVVRPERGRPDRGRE